jgi:hypothetical protein
MVDIEGNAAASWPSLDVSDLAHGASVLVRRGAAPSGVRWRAAPFRRAPRVEAHPI